MQYDENGYPVKTKSNNNSNNLQQPAHQREYDYGSSSNTHGLSGAPSTAATATASSAAAASPNNNNNTSTPQYDERGYPVKPQPQAPRGGGGPHNHGGGDIRRSPSSPQYDERGFPIKQQQPQQQQQQLPQGGGMAVPAYAQAQSPSHLQQQQQPQGGYQTYNQSNYMDPQQQQQQPQPYQPPAYSPTSNQNPNQLQQPQPHQPYPPRYDDPLAIQMQQRQYWTTGLCDMCSDCDVCVDGCCCWCCVQGRLYEAIEHSKPNQGNISVCCGACVTSFCCLYALTDVYNRRALIHKYNIQEESCLCSTVMSVLCPHLSVCQMHREMQARGIYPGGECCAPGKASLEGPPTFSSMGH